MRQLSALIIILALGASGLGKVAVSDSNPGLAEIAHAIPGFRLIVNQPPVPDTVFFDADNDQVRLSDFKGKVVLLNFWATWCKPCIKEMPSVNALQKRLPQDEFIVVAVASGAQWGKKPERFLAEHKLDALAMYHDPHAAMMKVLELETLPSTLMIDLEGRIIGGVVGQADWDTQEAEALVRFLLNSAALGAADS